MKNTHWAAIGYKLPNKRRIDRRLFVRFRSNKNRERCGGYGLFDFKLCLFFQFQVA
ncbi:MAG: hypothetical protein J5680_05880 [Neisseriaceae bacterium]|nr:hypothetical protein [Neisseriaceae bacterium]